jgi:hypothetical protein
MRLALRRRAAKGAPIYAIEEERQEKENHIQKEAPDHVSLSLFEKFTIIAAVAPQIRRSSKRMA